MNVIINNGQVTAISPSCNTAEVANGTLRFVGACITDVRYLASIEVPEGYETGMHLIRMDDADITANVETGLEALFDENANLKEDVVTKARTISDLTVTVEELDNALLDAEYENLIGGLEI